MTAVTGTYTEGATSGTSHTFTVPTGVVSGMKAIIVVATGSSASQSNISLSKSGATFTRVELIQATNEWTAVFEGTGLVAGDTVTVTLGASATVSIGHYYTDEWDPAGTIGTGGTRGGVSSSSTTSGSLSVTAGQRVFVVATERTTSATTVSSVTSSGGEAITQISFGEGATVQTSVFLGYFTAGSTGSRTVTITYSNSSGNGYAAIWGATALGGGGGPPPTSYLPRDILRITATGGGNNYFNVGIGKDSGHVDVWPDTIAGGYNETPFFYAKTNVDGLWVVNFHAPLTGGTTSQNTEYARSELRELTQGANSNSSSWRAAWDPKTGDHWIECWSRVTSLPPNKPQVCTVQAHDPDDDTIMILTQKVGGVVTLRLRYKGSDSGLPVLDSNYQIGREFYTKIRLINGRCEVYYYCPATGAGSMTTPISTTTTFSNAVSGWYYKAGCYNQSNETIDSSGRFDVEMRDLRHWHTGWSTPLPPWSTTIGGTPTVSAGADATIEAGAVFARSATETGTITGRQWKIISGPSGVGTTLSTNGSVNWTPTTQGTYVLGFYGTYSGGTAYDEVTVTVTAPVGGGEPTGSIVWEEEFPDGTPYDVIVPGTNIVNVSTAAQLTSALSSATAGSRIRLASGTYSGNFTLSAKQGNTGGGISIEAATPGGVTFAAGSTLSITSCREVTVSGLVFPWEGTGGNQMLKVGGSSTRIRVTRCTFGPTGSGSPTGSTDTWNYVYAGDQASHLRFDHNTFRRKGTGGNALRVYGDFNTNQGCPYVRIDHNLFVDIGPQTENDKEPIRLGVSTMSRTDSHSVIERNVFINCTSEPEVCSVKMGDVRVSGNVFLNCAGSGVSRHGRNNIFADNYWVDTIGVTASGGMRSGGVRFYDSGHIVRNNYMGGLQGTNFQAPLLIDTGDAEGSSTNLAGHWRIIDATVQWNFIVDCATGIQVGDNYSTSPANCRVTDNLVARVGTGAALTYINSTTIVSDADIGSLTTEVARNTYAATPDLHGATRDTNGIWRKAGYGPRVSYLTAADVGPGGDTGDTDRTGSGIGSGGGSTASPPVVNIGADVTIEAGKTLVRSATESGTGIFGRTWTLVSGPGVDTTVDPTRAASVLNWGPPHVLSDEFDYGTPGAPVPPNGSKWSVYDGPGHAGNGVRSPDRIRVNGSAMVMKGLAGSANTGGMMHRARSATDFANRGGRWEARCYSRYADEAAPGSPGNRDGGYHPLFLTWPDDDSDWPAGGEYDWLETGEPGEQAADGFLHYPSLNGSDSQIDLPSFPVDMRQPFNVAFEWTKNGLKGWINGQPWYGPYSGGATSARKAIQDMTIGRGTIQLDATKASGLIATDFVVEWFRFYELTAAGSEAPTPVVEDELATGTGTLNWVAPATLGDYVIRYAAENAYGIGTDEITVHVVAPGQTQPEPGQEAPPVFVGAGAGQSGKQATIDPAPAPGAKAGDFEIIAIASAGDESITAVPSGWTLLDSGLVTSPGGTDPVDRGGPSRVWVYYTTTQAGAAASFTKSGTRFMHAVRAAWRGHSSLGQHAVVIEAINTADLVHPVAPVAAVRDKSLAVGIIMADLLNEPAGPFQAPAGWTARYDSTKVSQTENESIAIADHLVAPGTVRGDFASTNADETAVFTFILEGPDVQNFSKSSGDTSVAVETATVQILDAGAATQKSATEVVSTVETETLRVFLDAADTSASVDTPGANVATTLATIEWTAGTVTAGKVYPLIVDVAPSVQWYALDPPLAVDLVETALLRWTANEPTGGKSGSIISPLPPPPERTRPRLLAQSIIDGRWLSMELPVNDPEITWQLSGATSISGSFAPEMRSIADLGLEPWGTWIYLEEDEEIRAAGILQPVQIDTDGRMSLLAVGPHAYAKRVPYRSRFSGIGIDPADAVRVMWDHIQAFPRGDLGVTIEGSTPVAIGTPPREVEFVTGEGEEVSFTAGPYTLDYWQNTIIGSEIEKLGSGTPFDFLERAAWRDASRTEVAKWIVIHYPSAGWRRTDLRFAQGENIIDFAPVEEPADAYADVVYVQGKGEGPDKVGAEAEAVVGKRIRLPAIVDDKTIASVQRAKKVANDELAARLASLVEVPEIVCDARHRNAPLGSFVPGDDILVQVIYPYVGVVAAWHRILSIKYVPWQNRMVLALTRRGEFRQ